MEPKSHYHLSVFAILITYIKVVSSCKDKRGSFTKRGTKRFTALCSNTQLCYYSQCWTYMLSV